MLAGLALPPGPSPKSEPAPELVVVATCPIALLPCSTCGHHPCPHCETSCDRMVEQPLDAEEVQSRLDSIELAPITTPPLKGAAITVTCGQCRKKIPLSTVHARSKHANLRGIGRQVGYLCSHECLHAWVYAREMDLCPCMETECTYPGTQNADALRWFSETMRQLGAHSSGLDDGGHLTIYGPKPPEASG